MSVTELQELVRFLEDRFACAQACTECARACALRASLADLDGPADQQLIRRKGILCAEVCDTTCRLLAEQVTESEDVMRTQVEWCRAVCLETADVFDLGRDGGRDRDRGLGAGPGLGPEAQVEAHVGAEAGVEAGVEAGAEESARVCRDCARVCSEFLDLLR
ncbi:ferredoxin [Streptomyces aurantiacus]|uniref:Ferredoxin n=1 Tax=Streptomyces aurantiacus TaxID=47760 RepID=A0A7G1PDU0_9ACTN|nr:ferredoxin [Streptomyces aurantiacus]